MQPYADKISPLEFLRNSLARTLCFLALVLLKHIFEPLRCWITFIGY